MINFFTNPWASSQTRGYQIAERLEGATVDKQTMKIEDKLVLIKTVVTDEIVKVFGDNIYLDVVDGYGLIPWLKLHPSVRPIAISNVAKKFLEQQLGRNDVILIPEQHCNFENYRKPLLEKPKVLGYIGYKENLHLDVNCIKKAIEPLGMTFETYFEFPTRESVCEFYKTIDIQLCFRVDYSPMCPVPELKNPLKLANAGSFGIPTIAWPELSYADEFAGDYIVAYSLDQVVEGCNISKDVYKMYSDRSYERSQNYHIDKIVELYKQLGENK